MREGYKRTGRRSQTREERYESTVDEFTTRKTRRIERWVRRVSERERDREIDGEQARERSTEGGRDRDRQRAGERERDRQSKIDRERVRQRQGDADPVTAEERMFRRIESGGGSVRVCGRDLRRCWGQQGISTRLRWREHAEQMETVFAH
jgi:hypothetical protein